MSVFQTKLPNVQKSKVTESQNHRITECQGLEGTSVDQLVQPSCQSRVTYSRLHRTVSRLVLNISREGESTTSLGNLFQFSITLRGRKFFLMFRQNFLCLSLCPLPLICPAYFDQIFLLYNSETRAEVVYTALNIQLF